MILKMLSAPLLGALIGYITNWLAVKMLFRPREAKYLFGHRIPFTPGVIPKGRERLGRAMGEIINSQLLTEEAIRRHLTSGEFTVLIRDAVRDIEEKLKSDDRTFRQWLTETAGEENTARYSEKFQDFLIKKAAEKLSDMQIQSSAACILAAKIGESLSGSFLGKFISDSFLQSLVPVFEKMIDDYILEHGESLLRPVIEKETDHLLDRRIGDTANALSAFEIDREKLLLKLSSDSAAQKYAEIIRALNIGRIAEEAVCEMDPVQLEELVLSAMKTELGAVVNLGALIGLLLGLINMAIYLI